MMETRTTIIPQPQKCVLDGSDLTIGASGEWSCRIVAFPGASVAVAESVRLLAAKMDGQLGIRPETIWSPDAKRRDAGMPVIRIASPAESESCLTAEGVKHADQAYRLTVTADGIIVHAIGEAGLRNGVLTLAELMRADGEQLKVPVGVIEDWPDLRHRGLFMEDRWGTDRMKLQDWKDLIDYMASLKMNFLNIGLYGCWTIQYRGEIAEYVYLPISKHPGLRTPKQIQYYSAAQSEWKTVDYLPAMYQEDSFGEVIAYGKTRGVLVSPLFNSFGHNTLIPRLYPETSAKDERGQPTKFGFCTSSEHTYNLLFDIYDEIIEKYLRPNGIDWFSIGLDEVWNMVGINPADPYREFVPWCKCDRCAGRSQEQLFIDHAVKLAIYLRERGIRHICMWHDQLVRMEAMNEAFAARLKQENLTDSIVLDWWDYDRDIFPTTNPELGMRRFVVPMTGYYAWMLMDNYLPNIYKMLQLGHAEEAEGTKAYAVFDYGYDRNYHCLAEYGWNGTSTGDLAHFERRYALKRFGGDERAVRALQLYDRIMEPELRDLMFHKLSYYIYTYVKAGKPYPRNFPGEAFEAVLADRDRHCGMLRQIYADSSEACALFRELLLTARYDRKLLAHYEANSRHYRILANEFLTLIELSERYNRHREAGPEIVSASADERATVLDEIVSGISALRAERECLMGEMEEVKAAYWHASLLRNMSIYRQFLIDLEGHFTVLLSDIRTQGRTPLPVWDLTDTRAMESGMFGRIR